MTSTFTDATSTDIADYNAFVTAVANTQSALAARDNTGTNPLTDGAGAPIYLLDGTTKIADNNADLWDGTLDAFFLKDETGGNIAAGPTYAEAPIRTTQRHMYVISGLLPAAAEAAAVPEPAGLLVLAAGLAGLGFTRRRRAR